MQVSKGYLPLLWYESVHRRLEPASAWVRVLEAPESELVWEPEPGLVLESVLGRVLEPEPGLVLELVLGWVLESALGLVLE